jgi:hypothetical protein
MRIAAIDIERNQRAKSEVLYSKATAVGVDTLTPMIRCHYTTPTAKIYHSDTSNT